MGSIVQDSAQHSCAYWATVANRIHLQKGDYSFRGREYLEEPMSSLFRRRCYMKSAQGGGSCAEILKSFHGMIYKRLPGGVLYLFPTSDDMHDYSKGVMAPLIQANPCIKKWVKNVKGSSDAAALKTVNGANLFMRGAGLTKIIEGEGETGRLKGITVDKVVFDEIELMDPAAIAKAVARMRDSEIKEEVYIGNPGIPDRGIDEIFSLSDQRHWFRKCDSCGEWTCAELTFPDCVKIRPDGTGYIGCKKCGERVFAADGQWVAQYPDKSSYMHGYRWSCLTTPNNDPADILENFTNPPQGNLADVYRLSLGLPYVASEDRLTMGQVLGHCRDRVMGSKDDGPCAFGLDVGKICHLVIGKRIGTQRYQIIFVGRFDGNGDWGEMAAVMDRANCRAGVIDARPYEASARRFQQNNRHMRIHLCEYSETTPIGRVYNNRTGIVKVNRTEICDETHDLVADDDRLVLPRNCKEIQEFARQVCDPAKSLEVNKKTKLAVYRYKGKDDHYRHALNYFLLATNKIARASEKGRRKQYTRVNNDYARI